MGYALGREASRREVRRVREDSTSVYDANRMRSTLDFDAIETIGDRIAHLAAHMNASKQELLELIVEFDEARGWEPGGHCDCAHWLSFRTGMSLGTAREHVRVALALRELPKLRGSMARGALSFCKARALTRVAKPETEADLLPLAEGATTAQVERMVRAWRVNSRLEEEELERQRHRSRTCAIYPEGGMFVVVARLPAVDGMSVMRAVDETSDELYRIARAAGELEVEDTRAAAARRRADALVELIERGIAAPAADDEGAPVSGAHADRHQVVLFVEPETLAAEAEPGMSELEDGTRISCETARRVACDAGIVPVTRGAGGSILDVGRRSRTFPPAIRRALEARDRGCRFPGCGSRYTEGHHVDHWIDGGPTSVQNGILLCRHHHRLVHNGGWTMRWWNERGAGRRAAFTDPRGQTHVEGRAPRAPELSVETDSGASPAATLAARNRERGAEPDAWTASACWKRERDIPDAVYFRAVEAGLS
ncbi:MAG: DUF222 domain-containing protein [Gemmatimonadales bacterium]|jgi:hypothetical protein